MTECLTREAGVSSARKTAAQQKIERRQKRRKDAPLTAHGIRDRFAWNRDLLKAELGMTTTVVGLALSDFADAKDGKGIYPSVLNLAEGIGMARSAFHDGVKALIEVGLLEAVRAEEGKPVEYELRPLRSWECVPGGAGGDCPPVRGCPPASQGVSASRSGGDCQPDRNNQLDQVKEQPREQSGSQSGLEDGLVFADFQVITVLPHDGELCPAVAPPWDEDSPTECDDQDFCRALSWNGPR